MLKLTCLSQSKTVCFNHSSMQFLVTFAAKSKLSYTFAMNLHLRSILSTDSPSNMQAIYLTFIPWQCTGETLWDLPWWNGEQGHVDVILEDTYIKVRLVVRDLRNHFLQETSRSTTIVDLEE